LIRLATKRAEFDDAAWEIQVLDRGGHHAHVFQPDLWLAAAAPRLMRSKIG
jgi:hypothetical protein